MSFFHFSKELYELLQRRLFVVLIFLIVGGVFEGLALLMLIPILQMTMGLDADSSEVIYFLDSILKKLEIEFTFEVGLTVFFLSFLMQTVFYFIREKEVASILSYSRMKIRGNLYDSLLYSEWSFFVDKKRGDLVSSVVNDCEKAGNAVYNYLLLLTTIVISLVYASTALFVSLPFTMGMVFFAGGLFFLLKKMIQRGRDFGRTTSEGNSQLQTILNEHFDAMKLIKGAALHGMSALQIQKVTKKIANVEKKVLVHNAKMKSYAEPLVIALLCVGIYFSVSVLKMGLAELMVVLFIFLRLFPRIIQMNQVYYQLLVYIPSFEKVKILTQSAASLREQTLSNGEEFKKINQSIAFKNVSFSYVPGEAVINDISFDINKGKTVAIVGGSGAGKSTINDIILGLIKPNEGGVFIDDRPIKNFNLISFRKKTGYVTQETILVHDTVRANIMWGNEKNLSEEQIVQIAKLCHVDEFVHKMPDGYDTIIGDKGMMLSGGQRQRLAIARALAREPELLILDEATSALDSESERTVQEAIESLSNKMTIVIIAHRLSTVVNADNILVLEHGSIVEQGTFDQLQELNGKFKYMYDLQQNGNLH
jgi:ABC-type multidrug transport system fused ATPase/permease subunit